MPVLNSQNYKISDITYINNLLTPGNKYNFEVIPPKSEGSIILSLKNKPNIIYHFITCKSKEIKFTFENSKNVFKSGNYSYQQTINENKTINLELNNNEILSHSFSSDDEFLFMYFIRNKYESTYYGSENEGYSIETFEKISDNLFRLEFISVYSNSKYYIIISKKDEKNNKETFSNPCYLSSLMIKNPDSIFVKSFDAYSDIEFKSIQYINITKLNINEGDDIVINLISQKIGSDSPVHFYRAKEFKVLERKIRFIHPDEQIDFNDKENIFKFEYKNEDDSDQLILFNADSSRDIYIHLIGPDKVQTLKTDSFNKDMHLSIKESNIYYFEIQQEYNYRELQGSFSYHITGSVQTIDLTKKIYSKNAEFKVVPKINPDLYKVINLKEDRYVFFDYKDKSFYSYSYKNPFSVCNDNTDECTSNIQLYKFLKGNNYTIKINAVPEDQSSSKYNIFPYYSFFPIFEDTIRYLEQGYHTFSDPQIYIINMENRTEVYLLSENTAKAFYTVSNQEIALDGLKDKTLYSFVNTLISIQPKRSNIKYGLFILIPSVNENPSKVIYADQIIESSEEGEFLIESGITSIIYFIRNIYNTQNYLNSENDDFPDYKNPLNNYNTLSIISSPVKNMKLIIPTDVKNESDLIIQNYFAYPIYVGKNDKDMNITIKKYEPRFCFFAADNNDLFNLYINEIYKLTELIRAYDLSSMNSVLLRIDSNQIPIYEFFNFYINNFKTKVNIYFKNYYGESDVYIKNMNLKDANDFSILTKPLKYYDNKNSFSNKLFSLENDTLLSLNLLPNSYFDLYAEIEDNKTSIDLFPIVKLFQNGGKLLQKNIEYTFNFAVDHLFKLEPGFNAVVKIYDENNNIITLNKSHPIDTFIGENVKIKSDNVAFVYFFGKILPNLGQLKIDPKEMGKNVEIYLKAQSYFFIDFGFDNYNPSDFLSYSNSILENGGYIYFENVYDKLKTNLHKDEYLYFYYISQGMNITINYTENIRHKNNEYNFYNIPKKSLGKSLVIKRGEKVNITYQVYFCQSPHIINIYHHDAESYEPIKMEFNAYKTKIDQVVNLGPSIKLTFDSEEDFIFNYYFRDTTDQKIKECDKWNKERIVLKDLAIKDVKKNLKMINILIYILLNLNKII